MENILIGRNGFLAQAVQRAADEESLAVVGSSDFDLLRDTPRPMEIMQDANLLIDTADYYPGVQATSQDPAGVYEKNVQMYHNLFKLAEVNEVPKIVTIGTTGCYPVTDELLHEGMFDGDASKLNKKLAGYALSRFTLLDIAALYRSQFGIEHSHLILPNFYGPGDKYEMGRSHLLASWVRDFRTAQETGADEIELWGPPTQRREFIFIDDAAQYVLGLGRTAISEEVLNAGTDTVPTYEEMASSVLNALDFECTLKWDLDRTMPRQQEVMDTTAMQKYAAGLATAMPFDQGVALTVKDFLHGTRN